MVRASLRMNQGWCESLDATNVSYMSIIGKPIATANVVILPGHATSLSAKFPELISSNNAVASSSVEVAFPPVELPLSVSFRGKVLDPPEDVAVYSVLKSPSTPSNDNLRPARASEGKPAAERADIKSAVRLPAAAVAKSTMYLLSGIDAENSTCMAGDNVGAGAAVVGPAVVGAAVVGAEVAFVGAAVVGAAVAFVGAAVAFVWSRCRLRPGAGAAVVGAAVVGAAVEGAAVAWKFEPTHMLPSRLVPFEVLQLSGQAQDMLTFLASTSNQLATPF